MKIFKILLGVFGCVCAAAIFLSWAYETSDFFLAPVISSQVYQAPKTTSQLVVITQSDGLDGPSYYLGVRASEGEKWRQFVHVFGETVEKPDPVWSRDGSVVALINQAKLFDAAYDFRSKRIDQVASGEDLKSTSRQISRTLQMRGGWQRAANPSQSHDLGLWRWQDRDIKALLHHWKESTSALISDEPTNSRR